jgi:hypothetical protein
MLYDQSSVLPQAGSPLESVFILLAKKKRETEYYHTKLMVAATLAPHSKEGAKMLSGAWEDYRDAIFPFLEKQRTKKDVDAKKMLEWWGKRMLKIRPLWRANENRGIVSKLRKGVERVKESERRRRHSRHRRI